MKMSAPAGHILQANIAYTHSLLSIATNRLRGHVNIGRSITLERLI